MQMTIFHGLPGSGKTYAALRLLRPGKDVIICRDDIRKEQYGTYWSPEIDEKWITQLHKERIINAFENGYSVIIPDTNLNKGWCQKLVYLAVQYGAEVDHIYIDIPVESAVKYADNRGEKTVSAEVVRRMAKRAGINEKGIIPRHKYHMPEIKRYSPNYYLPTAYVVDIDGTFAHITDRSPYDYSRVGEDILDYSVYEMVNSLSKGHKIVFMSGRSEDCREETEKWLKVGIPHIEYELWMRPSDDPSTADFIVKNEMFDKHIAKRYNVLGCIDDRRQVVAMYRTKGLKVYDVDNGRF